MSTTFEDYRAVVDAIVQATVVRAGLAASHTTYEVARDEAAKSLFALHASAMTREGAPVR